MLLRQSQCSTPFGITELDTATSGAASSPARGAQRLSASLNSTRTVIARGDFVDRCSTPFGITELDTQPPPVARLRLDVCSTPFGITELDTACAAGALPRRGECSTPFGITELDTTEPTPHRLPPSGAQRLSASLNSTRPHSGKISFTKAGCSTPFGITELDTFSGALNGLTVGRCSTPFGITELDTTVNLRRAGPPRVLNAFRHH